jgi:hypothetical protein
MVSPGANSHASVPRCRCDRTADTARASEGGVARPLVDDERCDLSHRANPLPAGRWLGGPLRAPTDGYLVPRARRRDGSEASTSLRGAAAVEGLEHGHHPCRPGGPSGCRGRTARSRRGRSRARGASRIFQRGASEVQVELVAEPTHDRFPRVPVGARALLGLGSQSASRSRRPSGSFCFCSSLTGLPAQRMPLESTASRSRRMLKHDAADESIPHRANRVIFPPLPGAAPEIEKAPRRAAPRGPARADPGHWLHRPAAS